MDGRIMLLGDHTSTTCMIEVTMGHQDVVQALEGDSRCGDSLTHLPGCEPGIHEDRGLAHPYEGRVPSTPTGEDLAAHEERITSPGEWECRSSRPPPSGGCREQGEPGRGRRRRTGGSGGVSLSLIHI